MENNNDDRVTITLGEYRTLLSQTADYAMIREIIKAGVKLGYAGELTVSQATIDVVLKYILGAFYEQTIEALKSEEA